MRATHHLVLIISLLWLTGCATQVTDTANSVTAQDTVMLSRGVEVPITFVTPAETGVTQALPLVVMIHGHGGTRNEAGAFERVAEQLADAGIASIRMDFPGCGDSTEPWANNNLTNMLADIAAAEAYAKDNASIDASRVALLGYSMGGRLAALHSKTGNYPTMVLWAPAVENGVGRITGMFGGEQQYRMARSIAVEQGSVPFTSSWGQRQQLGAQWFVDMEQSRPTDALARYRGNVLFIHGNKDDVVPLSTSMLARDAMTNAAGRRLHVVENADHGFGLFDGQQAFSDNLVATTIEFVITFL